MKPTPSELKSFAKNFEAEDWNFLCRNQEFLNVFTEDLDKCRILAEKTLFKKIVTQKV